MSDRDGFLARWSRRKHDAAAGRVADEPRTVAPDPRDANPVVAAEGTAPVERTPLPPLESLTPESDFVPFMARDVDPQTKKAALKTLFSDERFNVMDGLDVYIDDYTKPSPVPPEWYERMAQMAGLGDVPAREAAEAEARRAGAAAPPGPLAEAANPSQADDCKPVLPTDGEHDPQ